MKRLFVYVGSRAEQSTLTSYIKRLLTIVQQTANDIEINLHLAHKTNFNQSTGCKNCFNFGYCEQDALESDEMNVIKEQLLNADFIILASPVYSHNVSGDMKAFFDRLAYWGHIFRLAGKPAMFFASGTNGLKYVLSYMEKVMNYMGVIGVDRVSLIPNHDLYQNIEDHAEKIISYTKGKDTIGTNDTIEAAFLSFKYLFKNYEKDHAEYIYWRDNGLFECETYEEYLKKFIHV